MPIYKMGNAMDVSDPRTFVMRPGKQPHWIAVEGYAAPSRLRPRRLEVGYNRTESGVVIYVGRRSLLGEMFAYGIAVSHHGLKNRSLDEWRQDTICKALEAGI